jgi:hypothetical protein
LIQHFEKKTPNSECTQPQVNMSLQAVWSAYHRGEKQNKSHYKAYCKGCVQHEEAQAELLDESIISGDVTTALLAKKQLFEKGKQRRSSILRSYVDHETSSKLARPLDP